MRHLGTWLWTMGGRANSPRRKARAHRRLRRPVLRFVTLREPVSRLNLPRCACSAGSALVTIYRGTHAAVRIDLRASRPAPKRRHPTRWVRRACQRRRSSRKRRINSPNRRNRRRERPVESTIEARLAVLAPAITRAGARGRRAPNRLARGRAADLPNHPRTRPRDLGRRRRRTETELRLKLGTRLAPAPHDRCALDTLTEIAGTTTQPPIPSISRWSCLPFVVHSAIQWSANGLRVMYVPWCTSTFRP
jgi:hypothetical protein